MRLADAAGVRRIGTPFDLQEAVSGLKTYGEGSLLIWFLEDYRDDVVLVVRVQHLGVPKWVFSVLWSWSHRYLPVCWPSRSMS